MVRSLINKKGQNIVVREGKDLDCRRPKRKAQLTWT